MNNKEDKWVSHSKFGVGQIVEEQEEKCIVRFVEYGEKMLLKSAVTPGSAPANGFKFRIPVRTRNPRFRVEKPTRQPAISFDHLVAVFKGFYPGGFDGEKFQKLERDYKFRAVEYVRTELSKKVLSELIDGSQYTGVCKLAFSAVNRSNLVYPQEKIKLKDSLRTDESQAKFAKSLFQLLYGEEDFEFRFENWCHALSELGECNKWTIATYFTYLQTRGKLMFFKPMPTKRIADSLGFALNYRTEPNWFTYSKLLELVKQIEIELTKRDLKPRSGIDVQGFIWASVKIESGAV